MGTRPVYNVYNRYMSVDLVQAIKNGSKAPRTIRDLPEMPITFEKFQP